MDLEELKEEVHLLFHPEPDEDGHIPRELPNFRLKEIYGLDFKYMESFLWEGASIHEHTRLCSKEDEPLHVLTKNKDVSERLFLAGLGLFADSIIEYHLEKKREGNIRYYPPVVLTFWSAFETFVRYSSELLIVTALKLPEAVVHFLRDEEIYLNKGKIKCRSRNLPVLDRYILFLKHAYNHEVDRGAKFWQDLEKAKQLRNYYTHLDIKEPRVIKASEVLAYMEAILLGIIFPSSHLQKTLMLGIYWLYDIWAYLSELYEEYTERPFFLDWPAFEGYLFHCNFENIDKKRFPSMAEKNND